MKNNLYAMIISKSSRDYTDIAVSSFLQYTTLTKNDQFVIISNDDLEFKYNGFIYYNQTPQSFSKNCNTILDLANERNVFILSNDIVFTKNWNLPLQQYNNLILIPSCNQTHLYQYGNLNLMPSMTISDFGNQLIELNQIVSIHRSQNKSLFFERNLMAFYAFMLPSNVYKKIGYFDESFGIGGGEDVDYRLRAIDQDIPVKYSSQSYLLHFAGKSTWDGPELQQQIQERNQKYFGKFVQKYGLDLANFCLVNQNNQFEQIVKKYQIEKFIKSQNFSSAISTLLNKMPKDIR